MKFDSFLEDVKKLNLPNGKWAILGSGPLCIRRLRDGHDIDLIVTPDLFEEYKNKENWSLVNCFGVDFLQNNTLEMWKELSAKDENIIDLIKNSELIKGFLLLN